MPRQQRDDATAYIGMIRCIVCSYKHTHTFCLLMAYNVLSVISLSPRSPRCVEVSTSKTGKHGHAKAHIVAIDIFTGKSIVGGRASHSHI